MEKTLVYGFFPEFTRGCTFYNLFFLLFNVFARCDKVVPGLGATNLLLLLLLLLFLLLPVSEFLLTF
jgi:hypothetical protein